MKTYNIKNLTEDQLKLIIESLLYSTSTSVNARWYSEDTEKLYNLVIDLRKSYPEVLTNNIHIFDNEDYHDEYAENILKYFPELLETVPNI